MQITEISRKANYKRDGISITRVLDVAPYSEHGLVASTLLGGINYVGGRLVRTLPYSDPHIPWAFCSSVDVDGVGQYIGVGPLSGISMLGVWNNGYDIARMTVTYETLQQTQQEMQASGGPSTTDVEEMELASQSWDISAQVLTLPNDRYRWENNPGLSMAQTGTNATKVTPKMDLAIVRHYCVNRPLNAMRALVGRVNSTAYVIGGVSYPAETLRFDGATISQKITNQGVKFFEINYKFAVQCEYDVCHYTNEITQVDNPKIVVVPALVRNEWVGWNRLFRPDRGAWDYVRLVSDGTTKIYKPDTDIIQGNVPGFRLLFHPLAV